MKRVFLIYNPISGKATFKSDIDHFVYRMQNNGFTVTLHRLSKNEDVSKILGKINKKEFKMIVAAGGDGTINSVVDGIIYHALDIPLGILPVGTSNDFASFLNIHGGLDSYIDIIIRMDTKRVDIGSINGRSFVNVVSIGKLSSIAHKTNYLVKNNLGKLGYYINVLGQNPVFEFFGVRLIADNKIYEEDAMLVLVLNSKGAGGFKNLAPDAQINDKKFDVIVIKNCSFIDKLNLFIKILRGEHRNDDCILYLQTDRLYIECSDEVETDVDGEAGPGLPIIVTYQRQIEIVC